MGIFDDAKNKATEAAQDGKLDDHLDKAEDFAKDKVGEEHHDKVDGARDKIDGALGSNNDDNKEEDR
ncbi:Rv0909 family putative TA system antitoxin [Corynebacterium casei]|uniref:Rv0909 family putative TA system antitoxin n=1 Tax=Corynebacterium casei TaxID=160386 RepID=UPI0009C4AFAF|nr:Rv0909 family putative TA system antitoxin [Corynebacterium casei]MDN5903344.1 antitoxin [Corynebacterium casei]MDN6131518.1 antitoxin [Corynebacterium casei]MDN6443184.1 antitoxin [Corynebacterium casei]MDN6464693.1 antitoxin [Corynebacterium casei]MDN6627898.1 antitoxin [Corynebacterium casei]